MARTSDRERVLNLLIDAQALSSARIKVELGLSDQRYDTIRTELIEDGLAEKYACRGGGLRLTKKGERELSPHYEVQSAFEKESEIYEHLVAALEREDTESVAFDTGSLRKRGKWQNPDVTQVSIDVYPRLRERRVVLTTYEVKPWAVWNVNAVFEAASHARFAHFGYVALEWPEKGFSLSDPKIDTLVRECQRFGIGLATLEKYYNDYRVHIRLEAIAKSPELFDVEEWLEYALSRKREALDRFEALMKVSEEQLGR